MAAQGAGGSPEEVESVVRYLMLSSRWPVIATRPWHRYLSWQQLKHTQGRRVEARGHGVSSDKVPRVQNAYAGDLHRELEDVVWCVSPAALSCCWSCVGRL